MAETNLMPPVTPYLTVKGAAAAIELYKKAFGATENQRMAAQDGKRLMHADITINGGRVLLSDEFPEYSEGGPAVLGPTTDKPTGVAVALHLTEPAQVDATFKQALAAGCSSIMAPEDTFWNARFAMLRDPFGHRWMLNAPVPAK